MGDDGDILHHGDTVDVLGDHLARVTMEGDVGLGERLEDVITGLGGGDTVTGETVAHPALLCSVCSLLTIDHQNSEECFLSTKLTDNLRLGNLTDCTQIFEAKELI